jgi:hypothetical protein
VALKKPGDALKAKQRKQKIFVAIGAVALLAVGVFEYPMIMKLMGGGGEAAPPPPPAQTAAAPTGASPTPTSFAPPTPGAAGAAPVAGVGELVESDVPPAPTQSRLVGFNLFPSKDPFVQQVSPVTQTADIGSGSTSASGAAAGGSADGAAGDSVSTAEKPAADLAPADSGAAAGKSIVPASSGEGSSSPPTSGREATVETVTISVNGREEPVGKGGTFPHSAPTFRLVSFGKGTAEIGIVGGSYAAGGETVTLKQGEPLTLVNTTDDTRYRIVLVRTP